MEGEAVKPTSMTRAERLAFNRGLRAAVDMIRLYGDENMRMCQETIKLDPLVNADLGRLYSEAEADEMRERSDVLSLYSTGHAAVYHACEGLADMVLALREPEGE